MPFDKRTGPSRARAMTAVALPLKEPCKQRNEMTVLIGLANAVAARPMDQVALRHGCRRGGG